MPTDGVTVVVGGGTGKLRTVKGTRRITNRRAHVALVVACTVSGTAACSLTNDIDVCDRGRATTHIANRGKTDGAQWLSGPQAIAAVPGGALVVFTSDASGAPDNTRTRVHLARVGMDGAPQSTCETDGAQPVGGEAEGIGRAVIASAPEEELALVAYTIRIPPTGLGTEQLMGAFVRHSGCAAGEPFQIQVEAGIMLAAPTVIPLGEKSFLVAWTTTLGAVVPAERILRARIVQEVADLVPPRFLATELETEGETATLAVAAEPPVLVAGTALPGARVALLTHELGVATQSIVLSVYDDRLHLLVPPKVIWQAPNTHAEERFRSLHLAFDGEQLLAAWVARTGSEPSRIMGRFITEDGAFLRAPDAPDGEAFQIGSAEVGNEEHVAVAALAQGGFVVAWDEEGEPGRADDSAAGIRAVAFDASGGRRFSNLACGRQSFQMNESTAGSQTFPALAVLDDASVLSAWTEDEGSAMEPDRVADPSASAIRSASFSDRILFAVE